MCFACVVLLHLHLGLLRLLVLTREYGLLDLRLFNVSVLTHLNNSLTVLLRDHLIVLHLLHLFLNFLVVALLQSHDFSSTLLCLLDLLPCLHLFLLEKRNTVGQELRIPLDTMKEQSAFTK